MKLILLMLTNHNKKMKKILSYLFILITLSCVSQSSNFRILNLPQFGWSQRVVPNKAYLDSTLVSYWNKVTDGIPATATNVWSILGNSLTTNSNFIGSTNNRSLLLGSNNIIRLKFDSTGKAVFNSSTTISPALKYTDGNQSLNKVLTSDANGNATWQDLPAYTKATYMLTNLSSDIGGSYKQAVSLPLFVAGTTATLTATVTTTPTLLGTFATNVGYPGITVIPSGNLSGHYETEKQAGANNYYTYYEIYKRTSGGVETLIVTSDFSSQSSVNTIIQQTMSAFLASNVTLLITDRLVMKIYGVMLSSSAVISLYYDDNTNSRLELPITQTYQSNWSLFGNASTTYSNYIGTTDNHSFRIATNGTHRAKADSSTGMFTFYNGITTNTNSTLGGQTSMTTFTSTGTGTVNALITNTNSTLGGQTSMTTFTSTGTGTVNALITNTNSTLGGKTSMTTFTSTGTGTVNALITNTNSTLGGKTTLTNFISNSTSTTTGLTNNGAIVSTGNITAPGYYGSSSATGTLSLNPSTVQSAGLSITYGSEFKVTNGTATVLDAVYTNTNYPKIDIGDFLGSGNSTYIELDDFNQTTTINSPTTQITGNQLDINALVAVTGSVTISGSLLTSGTSTFTGIQNNGTIINTGNSTAPHYLCGANVSAVIGAGAGTAGTATLTNATNLGGLISITTGTAAMSTDATLITINWGGSNYPNAPTVILCPRNKAARNLAVGAMPFISATGTSVSSFTILTNGTGLATSTRYDFAYIAVGN